jgi:hypothetical protein
LSIFIQSSGYSSGQQNINPPCYMMPIQVNVLLLKYKFSCLFSFFVSEQNSNEIKYFPTFLQVHQAYQRQGVFFNYLMSCHDLWEQADNLVIRGNHTGNFKTFLVIQNLYSHKTFVYVSQTFSLNLITRTDHWHFIVTSMM